MTNLLDYHVYECLAKPDVFVIIHKGNAWHSFYQYLHLAPSYLQQFRHPFKPETAGTYLGTLADFPEAFI